MEYWSAGVLRQIGVTPELAGWSCAWLNNRSKIYMERWVLAAPWVRLGGRRLRKYLIVDWGAFHEQTASRRGSLALPTVRAKTLPQPVSQLPRTLR